MELRSRRRLRSPPPPTDTVRPRSRARQQRLSPREGADRISALTDDLLLQVLVHVGCTRTAARFRLLSRRWRDLSARLPEVVSHDVARQQRLGPREGADRISALTDDLLFLVLVHVGCARTAARFGLLSRRWRGLWAHLPEVIFRDVAFHLLEPALALVSRPALLRLDIRLAMRRRPVGKWHWPSGQRITSLLRAAERLSPEELVFTIPPLTGAPYMNIDLPGFRRATSIRLEARFLGVRLPPAGNGDFSALQTLSLSGCIINDLQAMVSRCPRLRVLRYKTPNDDRFGDLKIKVHSASLEELVVDTENAMTCSIDIVGPLLKQLTSAVHARRGLSVSISAPMVEKLSCKCTYDAYCRNWFGFWDMRSLSLSIATSPLHAPSLEIHANFGSYSFQDVHQSFAQETQKHLVADISVLNLRLMMKGHVFGAFVFHLLEMDHIRSAIRRLKVDLLRSEDDVEVHMYCGCHDDDEMSWRTQTISLPDLEEVEIDGIKGVDHELDFLKLLFRCAPMLRRMTLRQSEIFTPTADACKKIYNILESYPSVECYAYLGTDKQVFHPDHHDTRCNS